MTEAEERRAEGAKRVSLETLVEICGNEPGIPAFEAEAVDVSGRGMHLRTAYLPELGAPLVCRFEDRGQEILTEGVVAWRRESARGGEFGIQFTALDRASVEALDRIGGASEKAPPAAVSVEPRQAPNDPGARVRLHIDGLGSPMKARVREAGTDQVQVGSNLEFLKVGRHLEIEDLEQGQKRGARIERVNVALDPKTRIPQLVVVLRYDASDEATPEPSVIDADVEPNQPSSPPPEERNAGHVVSAADARLGVNVALDDELEEDEKALRGRIGTFATQAGSTVQRTSTHLARFGANAAEGVGRLFKDASRRVRELREQKAGHERPRRTSNPASALADRQRLRPQSGAARPANTDEASAASSARRRRIKKLASAGAGAGLVLSVVVLAMQKSTPPPGAETSATVNAAAPAGNQPRDALLKTDAGAAARAGDGVSADVPLFGPTPMATMEPAPLGPAPESAPAAAEAASEAAAAATAAALLSAPDEAFAPTSVQKEKDKPKRNPSDVEPWGRGKMNLPTVHRLRLDAPGDAIQGAITPTGFAVVIPERKVMESGTAISERDKRIAKVQTRNLSSGAQITFQFRNGVPGYRVRLRKDYVEFLVSKAEDSSDAAGESKSSSSKKSDKAKDRKHKRD